MKNIKTESISEVQCDGVFISIGRVPETNMFKGQLNIDEFGYIINIKSGFRIVIPRNLGYVNGAIANQHKTVANQHKTEMSANTQFV